jgi:hypothetical protein
VSILFSILLAAAASNAPVIQCVDTPEYDCKTGIFSGPSAQELFPQDAAQLQEIYQSYWDCHWQRVSQHDDFGSANGAVAAAILQQATAVCQTEKQKGDQQLDSLLAKQIRYGDSLNRERLRERSRFQGTVVFEYFAAGKSGQRIGYATMLEAVTKYITESNNAPNK